MKIVCLLAAPRTGSSLICDLLANHPDIESHSEIYHQQASFLATRARKRYLRIFSRLLAQDLPDIRDSTLVAFAHQDPVEFLDVLSSNTRKDVLFFKIFRRHLPFGDLDQTVISNPEIIKIELRRHPLDTFVSSLQAAESQQWSHRDTTDQKVSVDVSQYIQQADEQRDWMQQIQNRLAESNQTMGVLRYEELMTLDSNLARIDHLLDVFRKFGITIRSLENEQRASRRVRPKQNRVERIEDSIENWPHLQKALQESNRWDLLPADGEADND